uniref:Putative LAGLIDADG homing endonuclease n=1 Tax=Paradoxia multiseta TaxID=249350 RepID=A0A097KP94_9CHLO|nr:putative LAGLIDADG homing endonuclease [Paradoxia multiseta]AIT94985.1 putative LAGLIDADG homing endonuclease [Paradoxia multiseta]
MNKQNKAKIGSSETTREAFVFNLDQVLPSFTPLNGEEMEKKRIFLEWFIGFVEGDGSFALRKFATLKNPKNQRPSLEINQKQPKALYEIKKALGFGRVISVSERKTGRNYYRYSVYKLSHIKQLIALLNGNLLLDKTEKRFANWVTVYNRLCDQRAELSLQRAVESRTEHYLLQQDLGEKITLKQSARELDLNSAWLAGFTDAEGGFYASLSANKRNATRFRERLKFYIAQKGEQQLLQKIDALVQAASVEKLAAKFSPADLEKTCVCAASLDAEAGDAKPRYCEKCVHAVLCESSHIGVRKDEIYRLELTRRENLEALVDYFDRYPLLTKKRLMFIRWKRLVLRTHAIRKTALESQKGMRRYKKLYASVGRIREAYNMDQD